MKKLKLFMTTIIAMFIVFMVTGCGHNIASQSKGIGVNVSWNGDSYVPNVKLGYWDQNTAVVRGNTTFTSSTATGGGILNGEGGTSQTLQLSTGTQVNEGNIKDILMSPDIDTAAKIEFIKALDKLAMPKNDSAANKTTSAESKVITTPITKEEYKEEVIDSGNQEAEQEVEKPTNGKFGFEELTVEKNKKLTIPASIITKAGLNKQNTVNILSKEDLSLFCVVSEDFKYNEEEFELFKEIQFSEDGSLQFGIGKLLDVKINDIVGVDIYPKQLVIYKIEQTEVVENKATGTGSASSVVLKSEAPKALTVEEQEE